MSTPNLSIPSVIGSGGSFDTPEIVNPVPPSDSTLFGGGYDAVNVILGGQNNTIKDSRSCSIIQGFNNRIEDKINSHIIGINTLASKNHAFYVGCINGLYNTGDIIAFTSSDKNLKDNIISIDKPLDKILSLDAVEFDWNDKQETYSGHDIGLIAQQVEKIAPEIVATRENGFKAVKYDRITALLVGAIKEQQEKIKCLEERLSKLEAKVNC